MQMVYAYIMYFLLMGIYTVNNVPYCALNGVMTGDPDERTVLSSYRFVAMTVAQLLLSSVDWLLAASVLFNMLGLGGGFIYVPILLLLGVRFHVASATSLFVITAAEFGTQEELESGYPVLSFQPANLV